MQNFNNPEPMPERKDGATPVWPEVWADVKNVGADEHLTHLLLADMESRDQIGWQRYGGPLVVNDGRNTLVDLYQELLDAVVYIKKTLMEGRLDCGDAALLQQVYEMQIAEAVAVRSMLYRITGE